MIVGTAGHIDHGKTLLVKALTGVDCDRLKEEKARGITIELGFAYVPLPGGGTLGFVDVPGHERFVHTMLAGASSVDFVMLVVAATDGVMPQTREHLQILSLLGLSDGLVVLTKSDLVDAARLDEVEADVRHLLTGTSLEHADVLRVSATTGTGIDALNDRLIDEASSRPDKGPRGSFRMAVDRSFTVSGAGTVVTGVVVAGRVALGENVLILPGRKSARVGTIHALGKPADMGRAGDRVAVNIAGIDRQSIVRGSWLVTPEQPEESARFDATLHLLPSEPRPLRTWTPVHLHLGTSAIEARIVLLEHDTLIPGQAGLVQIVGAETLPVRASDRFVVRDAGGERTIGGGSIIDPTAPQRFRRTPERIAALIAMADVDEAVALDALLNLQPGIIDLTSFASGRGLTADETNDLIEVVEACVGEANGHRHVALAPTVERLASQMREALSRFHTANPERPGMTEDALRLALPTRLTRAQMKAMLAMVDPGRDIVTQAKLVRLASHTSALGGNDQRLWERLETLIGGNHRFRPPQVRELSEATGQPIALVRKLLKTMARLGAVVEVAADRFFLKPALLELGRIARDLADGNSGKTFTAAEFRDRAGSGRGVGIQILEHFDRRGLTLRQGDARRVIKDPAAVFGDLQSR